MDRSGSSCSSYPADCTKARIIYTARGHPDPHSSPLISLERQRRVLGLGLLPAADRLAAAPTPQNSHKREWREESDLPSPVPNTVPRSQSTTTLCFTQSVPDFYAVAIRKDPRRTREKRARCFFDYDGRNNPTASVSARPRRCGIDTSRNARCLHVQRLLRPLGRVLRSS